MDPTPVAELNKLLNKPALTITYDHEGNTQGSDLLLFFPDGTEINTVAGKLANEGVTNTIDIANQCIIAPPDVLKLKRIAGLSFCFLDKLSEIFKETKSNPQIVALIEAARDKGLHGISTKPKTKWFEQYFGFNEIGIHNTKLNVLLTQHKYNEKESCFDFSDITFTIETENYRQDYKVGDFSCLSLTELKQKPLREKARLSPMQELKITYSIKVGDISTVINTDQSTTTPVFQAASQFNLLEMRDDNVSPGDISNYVNDYSQGPRVALSSPEGTFFRNYLIYNGKPQTTCNQLNTFKSMLDHLNQC